VKEGINTKRKKKALSLTRYRVLYTAYKFISIQLPYRRERGGAKRNPNYASAAKYKVHPSII
jgi:hypothetical protein